MCGRFNVASTPGLEALLGTLGHDLALPAPRYNVAPTENVPLLTGGELLEARWWLTPHWAKAVDQKYSMFNARCERLGDSPAFSRPFHSQRGIVPMSSFIEWRGSKGDKLPWLITNEDEAFAVAALWDIWEGGAEPLLSCTLVTTDAAPAFRPWHARMPVLLAAQERERWLDNTHEIDADDPLFQPRLKETLRLSPLAKAVGNSRVKAPQLMASVGATVVLEVDE